MRPARRSRSRPRSRSHASAAATVSATGRSRSPAARAASLRRVMNPAYAGCGSHSGSDSSPIHGSTLVLGEPARRRPPRTAVTARRPPPQRVQDRADGRGVPDRVERRPATRSSAIRTSQRARSSTSMTWTRSVAGRHQHRLAVVGARDPRRPVAEPVAAVAVPADQAGAGQRARGRRPSRRQAGLLAGDLGGAVVLDADRPRALVRRAAGRVLAGAGHGVVGVHRPGGDVDPVPGARSERQPAPTGPGRAAS